LQLAKRKFNHFLCLDTKCRSFDHFELKVKVYGELSSSTECNHQPPPPKSKNCFIFRSFSRTHFIICT
jgi:hypothetical protein